MHAPNRVIQSYVRFGRGLINSPDSKTYADFEMDFIQQQWPTTPAQANFALVQIAKGEEIGPRLAAQAVQAWTGWSKAEARQYVVTACGLPMKV